MSLRNGQRLDQLTPQECRVNGLTDDEIHEHQHWRLIGATAHVIAERGYWLTTIADITTAAGVSKKAFYQHFSSKEEAFLKTYDAVELMRAELVHYVDFSSVPSLIATWMDVYLDAMEQTPELAHMLLFQAMATPAIRARRIATVKGAAVAQIRHMLEQARQSGLPVAELTDSELVALAGGIGEICMHYVHEHGSSAGVRAALSPHLQAFIGKLLRP